MVSDLGNSECGTGDWKMANEETEIWELTENGKVVIWETVNAVLVTGKQQLGKW